MDIPTLEPNQEALFAKLVRKGYTLKYIRGVVNLQPFTDPPLIRKMLQILKGEKHE